MHMYLKRFLPRRQADIFIGLEALLVDSAKYRIYKAGDAGNCFRIL